MHRPRNLSLSALLAVLSLAFAGCGGSDERPAPEPTAAAGSPSATATREPVAGPVLDLSEGSTVTVPAPNRSGVVTPRTPVELGFEDLECAEVLPGIGFDEENRNIDLVADDGHRLCLVAVAVTNTGTRKNFFTSRDLSRLLTEDGKDYPVTSKTYDYQAIADQRGQQLASTADLITPGETKYDYAVYEVPADAEPVAVRYDVAVAR